LTEGIALSAIAIWRIKVASYEPDRSLSARAGNDRENSEPVHDCGIFAPTLAMACRSKFEVEWEAALCLSIDDEIL
jgi:hypothetical protein